MNSILNFYGQNSNIFLIFEYNIFYLFFSGNSNVFSREFQNLTIQLNQVSYAMLQKNKSFTPLEFGLQ